MNRLDIGQTLANAVAALEAGRLDEARALCRAIHAERPGFGGAHYVLGLVELRRGQPRRAADHLRKAAEQSPAAQAPRIALARALAAAGRRRDAIAEYQRVTPPSPETLGELADLLRQDGRLEQAAEACRRAGPSGLALLGALLQQMGRPGEAIAALAAAPESPAVLNNLGLALRQLGRMEEAADHLRRALALKESAAAHANLAETLRSLGDLDGALDHARRAVALDRRDAQCWLALALVERARGDSGREALERALKLDDTLAHGHFLLGEAALAAGDALAAARHFRRCLRLDPADRHGAALALARATQAPPPEQAPEAYVRTLFDQYADRFDAELVGRLHYQGPSLVLQAVTEVLKPEPHSLDILDIGCGTGLVGAALEPLARRLDGVDLSPRMVERAARRGIYADLAVGDLTALMAGRPETYDVVAAGDVFVYLGALQAAFAAAFTTLKHGGALVFSVERGDAGYVLGERSRYAHGADYLRRTAEQAGFAVALLRPATTRHESGCPVPGWLAVLRKS